MKQKHTNLNTNLILVQPLVDNETSKCLQADMVGDPQSRTIHSPDINSNYEVFGTPQIVQINDIEGETLLAIDYLYKNTTLPLIFVNTSVSGISIKEQSILVKEDIEQVIRYFVEGHIAPSDASIAKFFQSHPGTMIYSPQLVRTIVSLEQFEIRNRLCITQRIKNTKIHEE